MSELYQQTEYRGHHINIYYDESPGSPRKCDNLGTFYTSHHRYRTESEFDKDFDMDDVYVDGRPGHFRKDFLKQNIALNIYLYDHSGLAVSSSPFQPLPLGQRLVRHGSRFGRSGQKRIRLG